MKSTLKTLLAAALAVAALMFTPTLRAATFGWSGGGGAGTAWLTSGNWTNNSTPSTNDLVLFGTGGTVGGIGINFNGIQVSNTYVGAIVLSTGSTIDRTVGNSSSTAGGVLNIATINGGAVSNLVSGRTLTLAPYGGGNTFPMTLTFVSNATFNAAAGASNVVTAVIAGTVNITNSGAGQLALVTNNTFTGKIILAGGTLLITNETGLGANPGALTTDQLTFQGGTLRTTNNVTIDDANRGFTLGTGGGTITVDSGFTLTVADVITGANAFTKAGPGALVLSANNTYSGTVTVNQNGLLVLTGTGAQTATTLNTTSILRVANSGALGTGDLTVNPNNAETGRLELSNNVSILSGRTLTLSGRNNTTDAIRNVGGNNTIAGSISFTTGGGTYAIQSDSGTLTLSGGVTSTATGGRTLTLQGSSGGTVSAPIINGSAAMALTKAGTGAWTLTAVNTLTGAVNVTAGSLILSGSGAVSNSPSITVAGGAVLAAGGVTGGFALETNQVLFGAGTVVGPLTAKPGTLIAPGAVFVPGTLTISNNVTVQGGSALNFDLASDPVVNSGSNDLLVINGNLSITGPVPITLAFPFGQPQLGVPYTLIRYSGTLSGGANLSIAGISSPAATLDTSVPGIITVTFTAAAANNIVWTGTNGFNWNLATTVNFTNTAGAEVAFNQGDNVLFDDSSTNQAVTLVGISLQPASVTVNSSSNFTFSGAGAIAGGSLAKGGTGTLTINNANTTPDVITIQGGTLKAGNGAAFGSAAGVTIVASGATLDVNGQNLGQEPVIASGAGVGGIGAIVNSGAQQLNAIKFLTLAGDTTFGGTGRWDTRSSGGNAGLSSGGQPYKVTKVGVNMVALVDTVVDPALGDIDVQAGTFSTESFTQLGDPTKTMTVWSNATFRFWNSTVPVTKVMVMSNTAKFFVENATANAFNGTIAMVEGTNIFDINASSALSVTGVISGAAALLKTNTGVLSLFATNTYTGLTIISNGLLQGSTASLPGAITNNAGLVINQNFDGTLAGPVAGSGSFIKRGTGRLTVTTPMSITGTVTNEAGTIVLGADNVLGFGLLDWRGAGGPAPAFESSDATARTLTNAVSISTDTRLGSAGSGDLVFSGPIANGGGIKLLIVSNAVTTFSSGFNAVGAVVKDGPGQLVLGSSNNNGGLIISNGSVTLAAGAFFMNNPHLTNRPGAVLDVSAGAGGVFNLGAGRLLAAGRTSGFATDIVGGISATGTVNIVAANVPGMLTLSGDLSANGATFNFDLASTTTTGGGVNDFINSGGAVTLAGTITINVNQLTGSLANGTYTLISGVSMSGAPTFVLAGTNGMRQTASLAIAGSNLELTVAGTTPAPLVWLGTAGNNWDVNGAINWSNTLTLLADKFFNGDSVLFDNSSANTNVQLPAAVLPGAVTVNSSSNYTLGGAGKISGNGSISKSGPGTLTLGNANDFVGPVNITGGQLKQANAGALGNSAGVTIGSGGQFDFAGIATTSRGLSFTIAGTGPDGIGAIKNTGANVSGSAISNVTLSANAAIGAVGTGGDGGRMDIGVGYGLLNGGGNTLTKIGPGFLNLRCNTIGLPEIIVAGGTLYTENIDNNVGAKVTVNTGARFGGTGARTYTNTVDLLTGSVFFTAVGNTPSIWNGPINVLGQATIGNATISAGAGAQDVRLNGPLNGSGNMLVTVAPLEITGNNDATYSGNITLAAVTLRLSTNGTHGTGVITNNGGTVEFNPASTYGYSRIIYGAAGTVTKSGTNILQLTGAGGDQIGEGQVLNVLAGTFDLNGRSEGVRALTGNAGAVVTNSSGSTVSLTLTNPSANPHTYNGSIGGPITVVVRDSSARNGVLQSFTGTNTFTGGLVIDNGQLRSSGDWVLGAVPGSYDPANIILRNNGTLQNNASTLFLHPNRGIVLESDGTFMSGFSAGNDIVVSGSITGPGRLLKADGQRLILKNANTFTGDTAFTNIAGAGTLRLDHAYALQNSTFDATGLGGANGTLDLNNLDVVVGMLKGTGATIANFNGRLTAGGNGQNGVFGSTLSGAGHLVKVGPGVLVLAAANNPFNGGVTVSNGVLINLGNLSGAGAVVVKSGAALGGSGSFAGPITAEPGSSVYPGASAGTMTISNSATFNSASLFMELAGFPTGGGNTNDLIDVKGNLTLAGVTDVRFSFIHGAPALGVPYTLARFTGTLTGNAANLASAASRYGATFDTSFPGEVRMTFSGSGSNLVWAGSATNNTWNLNSFTNFFNSVALDQFKDGDRVTFDDTGYAGAPINVEGLLGPVALTVNAAQDYAFTGTGRVSSPSGLVKLGAGRLTLGNTNDISGPITVNAGAVSLNQDDNIGLPPAAAFNQFLLASGTLRADGTFTLNSNRRIVVGPTNGAGSGVIEVTGTNVFFYGGLIGNNPFGLGALVKSGPGSLALSSANTHAGGTVIRQGTILVRNDSALGTVGGVTMGDAGTGADTTTLLLDVIGSGGNRTFARDITVSSAASGVATIGSTANPLIPVAFNGQFNGNVVLDNRDVTLRTGAGDFTRFSGDITGTGNVFIANGSLTGDTRGNAGNRVIWELVPKSFIGDITIQAGMANALFTNFTVLQINTVNSIRDAANVTVQENAVLRLNQDEAINNLTGNGRARGVVALRTLTVGAAGGSSTFNGILENDPFDGAAGALALTKAGAGTFTLNGTNTHTGATLVNAGTLAFGPNASASNSLGFTVASGATLDVSAISGGMTLMGTQSMSCAGTILGSFNAASNATINPGLLNVRGTMTVSGNVALNNSNRLNFDLGSATTIGGGVNDHIDIGGDLSLGGLSYVTINAAGPLTAGTYTLMTCAGTKAGGAANLVLINNTASAMTLGETANTIILTVTTAGRSLVWAANFTNSLWDINTTTNFLNGGALSGFLAGDAVAFDSTASNQTVTINATLLPSTISITGGTNYNFTGSGRIGGAASITQNSTATNTITLTGGNDYAGDVTINGGVLRAGNGAALGSILGTTIINPGGTLDINAQNLGAEPVIASGPGFAGLGAIVNFGADQTQPLRFVTLAGDTTFGGTGRWDIRANPTAFLSSGGNPYKLTKVGSGQFVLVSAVVDPALGDIDVLGGLLSVEVATTGLGDPTRSLNLSTNTTLQFFQLAAPLNKPIFMTNGSRILNNNGFNTLISPITLLGSNVFEAGGTTLNISNTISGPGTLRKLGANTLLLAGNNSYSGGSVLQAGTTILTGDNPNSGGLSNGVTLQIGASGGVTGSLGGVATNNGTINYLGGTLAASIINPGTINLQRLDTANLSFTASGAGTINHASGSGAATVNGGISNGNLRLLSGNGSALSLDAGNYAFNAIAVGPTPSGWMNILPGANVLANTFFLGELTGQTGTVVQAGGTVIVTNQFRIGHWPTEVSTYTLNGGSLSVVGTPANNLVNQAAVNEQNGPVYFGIDGAGILNQNGGALNAYALVMDGRGESAGVDTYALTGGTVTLAAGGIKSGNGDFNGSYLVNLGGGTVAASDNWGSAIRLTLTGTGGDVNFDSSGRLVWLGGQLVGSGGFQKSGAGTLALNGGGNNYSGGSVVNSGSLQLGPSVIARWVADDLNGLGDGGLVSTWIDQAGVKPATNGIAGAQPVLKTGILNGHSVVRFDGVDDFLRVPALSNALSGIGDFSVAVVFRATAAGVGGAAQWYNNSGMVDTEVPGATNDWGLAFNSSGQIAAGIGNADRTAYSRTGLNDGGGHVVLMTRASGTVSVFVDSNLVAQSTGSGPVMRNLAAVSFGRLDTGIQFFNGDIAEVVFYNAALSGARAGNAIAELTTKYGVSTDFAPASFGSDFIPNTSPVTVGAAGTLNLNDSDERVGSLAGQSGASVTLGQGTLDTGGNNASTAFAGGISGQGGLTKSGSGTFLLSGTSTYSGATLVGGGILRVDGALTGGTAVTVTGGTLAGSGTINGSAVVFGGLAPGASIGALTFSGAVTLEASAAITMEIDRGAGPNGDLLAASDIVYGGTLVVSNLGGALESGDSFNLFNAALFTGSFSTIALPALDAGLYWDTTTLAGGGTISVGTTAIIVTPPMNQTVECSSGTATFSVVAGGTPPFGYQWRSNAVAIAGANGASLVLNNLNLASSGNFDVVVTNLGGSATSAAAALNVVDTTPPLASCPANITAECTSPSGAAVSFSASATDGCDAAPAVSCLPASGSTFALGTNVVTCTATDGSGNTNACVFTVTIMDSTPPSITECATNRTLSANASCQLALPDLTGEVVATDICGPVTITQSPVAGTLVPLGMTNITLTATDPASNAVTCVTTLTVVDATPPSITCPTDFHLKTTDTNGIVATFAASASDTCAGGVTVVCFPASGSLFPVGANLVACSATDAAGNSNQCNFTVTVLYSQTITTAVHATVSDNDPGGLASVRNVTSPIGVLADVNISLHLSNGWNGDLYAYLVHDSGFAVLLNRPGRRASDGLGYSDPGLNVILDDQAPADIHNYRVTLNGSHLVPLDGPLTNSTWQPDGRATDPAFVLDTDARTEMLASFNGLNPNGEWTLFLADRGTGNISTLVDWELHFCGELAVSPAIAVQPQGITVDCGDNATFSVTATGTGPIGYHWLRDGAPIPGANSNTLFLPAVQPTQAGNYSVIVSNAFGAVTSATAALVVNEVVPVFSAQPQSRTNNVGSTATFSVTVFSCSPAAYQWCFGPNPVPGETNATLTISNVQLADAGSYTVKVSNFAGSVTSAVAVLTVNQVPVALPNGGATSQERPHSIAVSKLLANDADADGDPLSVTVSATSTNGGSVVLASGRVTYTPEPGFSGIDRYTYTIDDGRGGMATTYVEIYVADGNLPALNQVSITTTPNGVLLRFAGVPGFSYQLQRAPAVTGPWGTIATLTAPLHGIIEYEDTTAMGAAFYRTVSP